jgi:hypothetical protein
MVADVSLDRDGAYTQRFDLGCYRLGTLHDEVIDRDAAGVVSRQEEGDPTPGALARTRDQGVLAIQIQQIIISHLSPPTGQDKAISATMPL